MTIVSQAGRGTLTASRCRFFGPVAIVGWLVAPTRRVVVELLCYLALHRGRPVRGEELRAALWPSEEGVEASAKSLRTYMSLLRQCLSPELVPEATKSTGYRLSGDVTTDWDAFQDHVASADQNAEASVQTDALRNALALVRGMPFVGVASGTFMWAWSAEMLASTMEVAIVAAARRLVNLSLASGDQRTAMWATMRGRNCFSVRQPAVEGPSRRRQMGGWLRGTREGLGESQLGVRPAPARPRRIPRRACAELRRLAPDSAVITDALNG